MECENSIKKYSKIHVAVNEDQENSLMIKVTNEHMYDNKALPGLVENITKSDNVTTIGKLFADDSAYDGNDIFRYIADNGILPCIKVRKNAKVRCKKGNILRNPLILTQKCVIKLERPRKLWTKIYCCRDSNINYKENV